MPWYTMERHERYDPEDIESLLSERGFDELLDDERAFVLRHISSREEYERMRALLHYVRPDEQERATIEPEDRVRRNVMTVFREQRTPKWRIWLNTLAAWAAPAETTPIPHWRERMWRPTLAFGTLALLIVVGVAVVFQTSRLNETAHVAEVRTVPNDGRNEAPTHGTAKEESAIVQLDTSAPASAEEEVRQPLATVPAEPMNAEQPTRGATAAMEEMTVERSAGAVSDLAPSPPALTENAKSETLDFSAHEAENKDAPHTVTADELARNQSVVNATGEVMVASTRKRSSMKEVQQAQQNVASRSLAADPTLLALVTTGW